MPTRALQTRRACRAAAITLAVAACAAPRPPPDDPLAGRPLRTLSPEELVAELGAQALAVRGVKGRLTLDFQATDGAERRSCRAALVARSAASGDSAGLYLTGMHRLAPTVFTLVSDGERFWLHVPRDNVLYTGPVARRRGAVGDRDVRLDARDLLRALFVEPLAADAVDVVEEPSAYVVSASRAGALRRRLWIERRGLTVQREVFLDDGGAEELVVERGRYRADGGVLYPARIRLREPATGAEAVLEFEALTVNPADLAADAFRPIAPPDARVVTVAGLEGGT
jgi:hypothetical protein